MRRNSKSGALIFAAATAAMLSVSTVRAADITWAISGPADFNVGTNWTGGNIPGSNDYADINNGGTVTIGSSDPTWTVNQLFSGNGAGTGNVLQTGGTLDASGGWLCVGINAGTGNYNMTGGTINVTGGNGGQLQLLGNSASGVAATTMEVSGNSTITTGNGVDIGLNSGSTAGGATLMMSGGTINTTTGDESASASAHSSIFYLGIELGMLAHF